MASGRQTAACVVLQWGTKPPKEDREPGATRRPEDTRQAADGLVVSGGAKGEDELEGRPAILDLPGRRAA